MGCAFIATIAWVVFSFNIFVEARRQGVDGFTGVMIVAASMIGIVSATLGLAGVLDSRSRRWQVMWVGLVLALTAAMVNVSSRVQGPVLRIVLELTSLTPLAVMAVYWNWRRTAKGFG